MKRKEIKKIQRKNTMRFWRRIEVLQRTLSVGRKSRASHLQETKHRKTLRRGKMQNLKWKGGKIRTIKQ